MTKFKGPTFRYGPNGEARIFHDSADVPEGWQDHPGKVQAPVAPPPAASKPAQRRPVRLNAPPTE